MNDLAHTDTPQAWHQESSAMCEELLACRSDGLDAEEVSRRQQRFGANQFSSRLQDTWWQRLARQFHNLLIYVLLVAAAMTFLIEHWIDGGVILGVVVLNALIGFIQEGKAEQALAAIRLMLSPQAVVIRAGKTLQIDARELVPGDRVLLQPGDKVPADLRLVQVKNLHIDEAILTGESQAVNKHTDILPADTPLGDRRNMAYSGTLVTHGQGSGLVIAIGQQTEIGRISVLLQKVSLLSTPLTRQMKRFAHKLTIAILILATVTFVFGVMVKGYSVDEMFLAAVGLSVAAIPEGLPAIMTIALSIGVQRMARRNAIIRRLPAVETLGSVTVICSDKTGTLTRNEMTAQSITTAEAAYTLTGTGYDPHGVFLHNDHEIDPASRPNVIELARAALLCNDARLLQKADHWMIEGDPTEGALVSMAHKLGLLADDQLSQWPRLDTLPFDSSIRLMATLHHDHAGHRFIYVKGAPEAILALCTHQRVPGQDQRLNNAYWHESMETIAARGQRLLAIALAPAAPDQIELSMTDLNKGLILLGLIGLLDPPRPEAIKAIAACQRAGMRVKMITGDHATTAIAIGRQMGLDGRNGTLTGRELDALNDEQLLARIQNVDIYARTSPEHKLRLVQLLQAQGQVIAMTGDGVNDAPALKRADVGIAMGLKGTEVAKEAAEMVLADDNFATIAHAIEQGRTVYDNLKKAILFILPTNGGEAMTIMMAIALGTTLPITPVQILWVNMVTAVTLALALAFEPTESGVMQRQPRAPQEPLLSHLLVWRVVFVSMILMSGTMALFIWHVPTHGVEYARTVAVNTLVCFEIFYLWNARYINAPVLNKAGLLGNRVALWAMILLIVLQLLFTYTLPMQTLFGTVAIRPQSWLVLILVASSVLFLVEIEKALSRRYYKKS